ncbi:MAG: acylphosphatase [Phycisphaerales bacterium]
MRLQIRFIGRVQGVGFRATMRHIAHDHPVTGWVRNEPDGSVLAEIQGNPHAVEACLVEVRRMMAANIASSASLTMPDREGESGFVIQR